MKTVLKYLSIAICAIFLISCNRVDNKEAKEEVKTEIKSEEVTEDNSTKEEKKDELKEKAEIDSFFADANYPENITAGELDWIQNTIKTIETKDSDSINKILGGSAKTQIDPNPLVLENALKPLVLSGNLNKITNIEKEMGSDGNEPVNTYKVLCDAEKSDIYFILAKNKNDKLASFQLILADALENQESHQEEYKEFSNRAYEILGYVFDANYDAFIESTSNVDATPEDIDNLFYGLNDTLVKAGEITEDKYLVGVEDQSKMFGDNTLEGKVIQVYIQLKSLNIESIDFNAYFDEDMNLIGLDYNAK